ncbi:ANTAR domain-containing protein [Kribbella amoyensis]|uniref:ANTAR domain-containing protein n=1 Tax=Kribbella amoyensis TaxID=996641 RepID=A0A561BTF4_9ACTN|nr:ANTAR domain-containing protein [Kribbella amoyensis]TWD82156.1 ANTAR domain-containing protein [Kribbella amoyensis]
MTEASQQLPPGVVRELAAATTALTEDHDVVGTLTQLLVGCARVTRAEAAGLLVQGPAPGSLELLASTSHRAAELELYQLHTDQGPCIEAIQENAPRSATGLAEVTGRWPQLVGVFLKNDFTGAHASPLRWRGEALGALGLFFADGTAAEGIDDLAQAFADMATLTIVHAGTVSADQVIEQTQAALAERTVIEQAKGVLAYQRGLQMDASFDELLTMAAEQDRPAAQVAAEIVRRAATGDQPS